MNDTHGRRHRCFGEVVFCLYTACLGLALGIDGLSQVATAPSLV